MVRTLSMADNRQFDYFIIVTMILTAAHDPAIRWPDRDSDRKCERSRDS